MASRIEREKRTVELMVRLYCRHAEGNAELCPSCRELLDYALARTDRCLYAECKPSCRSCTTHCYKPAMRDRIREVMRFSGPWLIVYAPGAAVRYLLKR